jgi:hypothetical protein
VDRREDSLGYDAARCRRHQRRCLRRRRGRRRARTQRGALAEGHRRGRHRRRAQPLQRRRHRRWRPALVRRRVGRHRRVQRPDGEPQRPRLAAGQHQQLLDVAVTGEADDANVYVADASGIVSYSFENGESGEWNSVQVGQGYALAGIDFHGAKSGHIVNTNGNAFATDDGTAWDKIGVADSNGSFYGVDSDGPNDVWVAADGGVVFRYDGASTKTSLGDPSLRDIEVDGGLGYTVGESGRVFEYSGSAWNEETTETGQNLRAVATGDPAVAVGDSSTVITD